MIGLLFLLSLVHPESILPLGDHRAIVSSIGEFNQNDGTLVMVTDSSQKVVVTGLRDPKGLAAYQSWIFVTDVDRIWRVHRSTWKAEIYVGPKDFPEPPQFLNDITAAPDGTLYVSDTFREKIFQILPNKEIRILCDADRPNGVFFDKDTLYFVTFTKPAELYRVVHGQPEKLYTFKQVDGGDGLWKIGKTFVVSGFQSGTVVLWSRDRGEQVLAGGLITPADLVFDAENHQIIVPLLQVGRLRVLPLPNVDH